MLLVTTACVERSEPTTPPAPVYLHLSLQASAYRPLASPGGMVRITTPTTITERIGYGGVAVVRSLTEMRFYAYDLACPHEARPAIRVEEYDLQLRCPSCGSTFEVVYGSGAPTSGPARAPLRSYVARYDALLHHITITNQ